MYSPATIEEAIFRVAEAETRIVVRMASCASPERLEYLDSIRKTHATTLATLIKTRDLLNRLQGRLDG